MRGGSCGTAVIYHADTPCDSHHISICLQTAKPFFGFGEMHAPLGIRGGETASDLVVCACAFVRKRKPFCLPKTATPRRVRTLVLPLEPFRASAPQQRTRASWRTDARVPFQISTEAPRLRRNARMTGGALRFPEREKCLRDRTHAKVGERPPRKRRQHLIGPLRGAPGFIQIATRDRHERPGTQEVEQSSRLRPVARVQTAKARVDQVEQTLVASEAP
jgi:hypothetical protein